jgi:hypothetical protein
MVLGNWFMVAMRERVLVEPTHALRLLTSAATGVSFRTNRNPRALMVHSPYSIHTIRIRIGWSGTVSLQSAKFSEPACQSCCTRPSTV